MSNRGCRARSVSLADAAEVSSRGVDTTLTGRDSELSKVSVSTWRQHLLLLTTKCVFNRPTPKRNVLKWGTHRSEIHCTRVFNVTKLASLK